VEEKRVAVIAHSLLPESKPLGDLVDVLALSESQESMKAFDQFQRAAGIGLLETALELLAGERAELYGKGHERYLLQIAIRKHVFR
jgi:hypothetical protein